jgi:hypothetical protein
MTPHFPKTVSDLDVNRKWCDAASEHHRLGDDLGLVAVFKVPAPDSFEQWRTRK